MNIVIRSLGADDIKSYFDCGNIELNQFFKNYASQNQFKNYIGVTYVAVINNIIVGFITISASSIKIDNYTNIKIKLPKYPLPILRISRLAVDINYQNKGIGKKLFKQALNLALEQKNKFGCIGVVVDAKKESLDFYKQFGFEFIDIINGHINTRPFYQIMFLSIKTIQKAMTKHQEKS